MSALQLRHYAGAPVEMDWSMPYVQRGLGAYNKPRGLWVTIPGDDDWPTWCAAENFGADRLTHVHEVVLVADANVLELTTPDALDEFSRDYGVDVPWGPGYYDLCIDWVRVAREFAGIIIAPYQWGQRMSLNWYYGWDVASGCIWDLTAIESVTLVSERVSS